jgi:hypothetical protein
VLRLGHSFLDREGGLKLTPDSFLRRPACSKLFRYTALHDKVKAVSCISHTYFGYNLKPPISGLKIRL